MAITKKQFVFDSIQAAIIILWIFIPEYENTISKNCFHQFVGNWIEYHNFYKIQFYYFLVANFVYVQIRNKLNYISFILFESLLLIPIIIDLNIYYCSK